MKKNILITSISAKIPLINALLESKNKFDTKISIFGADADKNCIGRYFVDFFWLMPKLDLLDINDFIAFCDEHNIRYVIPTRDADLLYFSAFKEKLLIRGICLFSADRDVVERCFDKLKFYTDTNNKLIIPAFQDIQQVDSPKLVVKERFGSGSENIAINVDKATALNFSKKLKEAIFQPYIEGQEFSVDSYVEKDGKCIASIVRSRDLVKNGESQITTFVEDKALSDIVKKFVEDLNILGHSVTQVIKYADTYRIIECNARFGGASTLSYKMGLDSFYWFLMQTNNKKITFELNKTKLKQVRVAEDRYFEC